MTFSHGAGVHCPSPNEITYSLPPSTKPPRPLKKESGPAREGLFRVPARRRARDKRAGQLIFEGPPDKLFFERPAIRDDHNPRDRMQQNPVGFGHYIRAAKEDAAGLVHQGLRAAYAYQALQFILQRLNVARRMIVQDHQVENQALSTLDTRGRAKAGARCSGPVPR